MKLTYQQLEHQTWAVDSVVGLFDTGANALELCEDDFLGLQNVVSNKLEMNKEFVAYPKGQ